MTYSRVALDLLASLEREGFTLLIRDGKLLVLPGSKLPPERRADILALKPELIELVEGMLSAETQARIDAAPPPEFEGSVAVVSWSDATGDPVGAEASRLAEMFAVLREHEAISQERWERKAAKAGETDRPVKRKVAKPKTLFEAAP